MSSRKGGGKPLIHGTTGSLPKGKGVSKVSGPVIDQVSHGVADISLGSEQDGEWEVHVRKAKGRRGLNLNVNAWGNPSVADKVNMWDNGTGRGSNAWSVNADSRRPSGRGNAMPQTYNRGFENSPVIPSPVIPPPLEHGRSWANIAALPQSSSADGINHALSSGHTDDQNEQDDDDDGSDVIDDSDDELDSDEFDSDESQRSHETRKMNKWFKAFFELLDRLTVEEMNEPARQWHCPACQGGPGSIDWYRGLQPLVTHAKTKGSQRVKLHRELANLLDEELRRRGTSAVPAGESFGKWKGLNEEVKDRDIVWPPMVIVMNTKLDKDDNDKWIGMGNPELLDYFGAYAAVKARHSYGPQGHRGMSVLIFQSSAVGYQDAERLDNHFKEEGTDREAWDRNRVLFYPGGKRQLYGYLAKKEDIDIFNQHCQGKSKLKFEMRSYQEMVWKPMKQMSEDNQQLLYYKNQIAKEERHSKALEESFGVVSAKLRKTLEEHRIVRQRTKIHHEQNKEEMDYQALFFKEQLKSIQETRDANEDNFEKIQQEEREKVKKQFTANNNNLSNIKEQDYRAEKIADFINLQDKVMEEFEAERGKLIVAHEEKKSAMERRYWEEKLKLEQDFDNGLNSLMDKYAPHHLKEDGTATATATGV